MAVSGSQISRVGVGGPWSKYDRTLFATKVAVVNTSIFKSINLKAEFILGYSLKAEFILGRNLKGDTC